MERCVRTRKYLRAPTCWAHRFHGHHTLHHRGVRDVLARIHTHRAFRHTPLSHHRLARRLRRTRHTPARFYGEEVVEHAFEQTITAPVLLLLLYIALTVITDVQFSHRFSDVVRTHRGKTLLGFVNGNDLPGFAGMILSFLVAMGLLLAVTIFFEKTLRLRRRRWSDEDSPANFHSAQPHSPGEHQVDGLSRKAARKIR